MFKEFQFDDSFFFLSLSMYFSQREIHLGVRLDLNLSQTPLAKFNK